MTTTKTEPAKAAPRDLIAEARGHINQALEALSCLDRVLGEISTDQESVSKIKQLLQAVMK